MMSRPKRTFLVVLFLTLAGSGCISRKTFADRVDSPNWPDFSENVNKYTAQVDGIEKGLPPLGDKSSPEQIVAHQQALAKGIRAARSGARQGEIFTPAVRERFVTIVRSEISGSAGKAAKEAIREDNPNKPGAPPMVPLAVNAVYPDAAPLSTVPPTLLLRLPVLPPTLEYRFVGKALVLRDVRANTIVDWIPNILI